MDVRGFGSGSRADTRLELGASVARGTKASNALHPFKNAVYTSRLRRARLEAKRGSRGSWDPRVEGAAKRGVAREGPRKRACVDARVSPGHVEGASDLRRRAFGREIGRQGTNDARNPAAKIFLPTWPVWPLPKTPTIYPVGLQ